ncbi:MAG: hypothetical protein ACFCA4_12600 [Cyanophyceae cyanobacterium]
MCKVFSAVLASGAFLNMERLSGRIVQNSCRLVAIPRPLPKKKIQNAAKLFAAGWTLQEISETLGAAVRTVSGWKKSDEWRTETEKLAVVEQQAQADLLLNYKEAYVQEMLASRDIMRKTLNAQMQVAGQLAIAASKASALILKSSDPMDAVMELSKGGVCHVSQTSSMVSKSSQSLLEAIYGINRVIERLQRDENGDRP